MGNLQQHRLRIALVLDYALDYLGGAQSAFLDQVQLLRGFGCQVTVIAPAHGSQGKATVPIKSAGVLPIIGLPVIRNTSKLRQQLAAVLQQERIQIVHVHSEFGLAHAAVAAAKTLNIPVVQTVHTFFWQAQLPKALDYLGSGILRGFLQWLTGGVAPLPVAAPERVGALLRGATAALASRANAVISPSSHQAQKLTAAQQTPVVTIPNAALAASKIAPYTQLDLPLKLVWIGRLVPEKRLLEFLQAVALACQQIPAGQLSIRIVGAGPLAKKAQKAAAKLPVTFVGRLNRQQVHSELAAAHATVLTSYGFDNQPVTIIESVNAARPVMLCDPRLQEGLRHGSGIYAADASPVAFAALLVALVQQPERLVAASAATVADRLDFAPETHYQKLINCYQLAGVELLNA